MRKAVYWLLGVLMVFLPASAWLVSITGHAWVALGRDVLLAFLIMGAILISAKPKSWWSFGVALLFIVWGLTSYFWRQEDLVQWLRGVRFVLEPAVLFATLLLAIKTDCWDKLRPWLFAAFALTILAGFTEYFFPHLFRYTLGTGYQIGSLEQIHFADKWQRMQATLAGPNALGLYLLVALLSFPIWLRNVNRYMAGTLLAAGILALVLTFSRSAYLGFGAGLLTLVCILWISHPKYRWVYLSLLLLGVLGSSLIAWKTPSGLLRPNSNQVRLYQYERVWAERENIGLFGRGIGSAGLVSQNRLDGGPNNYTENTYLDIFEALGLVGVALYLLLWTFVIAALLKAKECEAKVIGAVGVVIFIAGIFINHYTGQAAIWTFWLLAGTSLAKLTPDNGKNRA